MTEHCANFDPSNESCRSCPGMAVITRSGGAVEIVCRAGEQRMRDLIASSEIPTAENDLPVFPIRFPAPHP